MIFGVDVSRYQGKIDWDAMDSRPGDPVVFAGIRATVSWGYQDSWFPRNWAEAKRVGILRMAYHVVFPGEDPIRQIDNLMKTIGDDIGELPPVLDLELDHGYSTAAIIKNIYRQAVEVEARTFRRPILYSRASWVDQYLSGAEWLDEYDWWLANYLRDQSTEHPGPPILPKGVTKYLIHQTSGGYPSAGFGVESKEIDTDRWNSPSVDDVYRYAGLVVDIRPTLEQRVERLETRVELLEHAIPMPVSEKAIDVPVVFCRRSNAV